MAIVNRPNEGMHQASAPPLENELWNEIVDALTIGSDLYKAAFTQLQGSADPFQTAMAVVAALPSVLRKKSQLIIRTWATREAARQEIKAKHTEKLSIEKAAQSETFLAEKSEQSEKLLAESAKHAQLLIEMTQLAQQEKKEYHAAALQEKKAQREHELALLRLAPQQQRTPATKRAGELCISFVL